MAINGQAKGKRAEREIATMMREAVETSYGLVEQRAGYEYEVLERPQILRNLDQSAVGGYDVKGIPWMACEVKHHKDVGAVETWWQQCVRQTREGQMPVLVYRGDRTPWRVRTCATLQGMPGRGLSVEHWCVVDLTLVEFMRYVNKRLISDAQMQMIHVEQSSE